MTVVRDYDLHPPDDLRLFPMPEPGILRLDDRAFVAVVGYGDIVLWHYAFADHWFKINATTDPEGRLVETTAPEKVPPFTFNCDIATRCGATVTPSSPSTCSWTCSSEATG
jgi:hypothetical protein